MLAIDRESMRALCGGEFPHGNGFVWDCVHEFRLEDGVWEPYAAGDELQPGPGLRVKVSVDPISWEFTGPPKGRKEAKDGPAE